MFQSGIFRFFLLVFSAICVTSAQENLETSEVTNAVAPDTESPYQPRPPDDASLPPPRLHPGVGQLFDSDLANSFLNMQKRISGPGGNPSDPTLEEISIPKSNPIFTDFSDTNATDPARSVVNQPPPQYDDYYDLSPDLVGGELAVRSRQVGKTREQVGFNGSMDGFKNQGDFLPWMLLTETTPTGSDEETTTPLDSGPGSGVTTKPLIIPPSGAPIDSIHVLPLKPVPRMSNYQIVQIAILLKNTLIRSNPHLWSMQG